MTRLENSRRGSAGFENTFGNFILRCALLRMPTRLERSSWNSFSIPLGFRASSCFHPYAARIAETLLRVARDEQPIFQGLVHSIATLLDTRAMLSVLAYLSPKRNTLELSRELKILRTQHSSQRLLDETNTAAAVLVEGIDRYEPEGSNRWKLLLPLCSDVDSKTLKSLKAYKYLFLLFL
jgi:hypothetical protein